MNERETTHEPNSMDTSDHGQSIHCHLCMSKLHQQRLTLSLGSDLFLEDTNRPQSGEVTILRPSLV